jgi:hypothetical protein
LTGIKRDDIMPSVEEKGPFDEAENSLIKVERGE